MLPASANVIGKIAHGIADDMLTTTVMACRCKKILAPAMNTNMYENPIFQDNLDICRRYGMEVITPACGISGLRGHRSRKDAGAGGTLRIYTAGGRLSRRIWQAGGFL